MLSAKIPVFVSMYNKDQTQQNQNGNAGSSSVHLLDDPGFVNLAFDRLFH